MGKILFQGDSVTDANRTESQEFLNGKESLGKGYPLFIAQHLKNTNSSMTVMNRGISGNRVRDLKQRWEQDCLAIEPVILTILIGINDCWRKYDSNDETSAEKFESDYEDLIIQAQSHGINKMILMEPFVLPIPDDRIQWRETLDPMIHAVRRLAKRHHTEFIPLDGIFAKAGIAGDYYDFTVDGVHPTDKGHRLIADEWMKVYKSMN